MDSVEPEVIVDGEYLVFKTPYAPDYVQELKERVPQRFRLWVPQAKAWKVHCAYRDIGMAVFNRHFPRAVEAPDDEQLLEMSRSQARWLVEDPTPIMTRAQAYEALWLIEGAPRELIDAAFRELNIIYEDDPRCAERVRTAYRTLVEAQHQEEY